MSEDDETIYDEEGREDSVDNAEISPEEEGFMKGYEDASEEEDEPEKDPDDEEDEDKEE
jgi:hypothetical protein